MPVYEYQCRSCGRVSEHLVGVGSEQPDLACAECGSGELRRMISLISVQRGASPEGCCGGACESGACDSPHAGSCACGA